MTERVSRITASDVALEAGVSISAVSRVFTPGASVSSKMRDRVLAAAEKLDYMPNVLARSLMTQRTALVGIILANFQNPMHLTTLDLFTSALQARGLRALVFNVSKGVDVVESARQVMQYGVDGLVVAAASMSQALVDQCARQGIPLVAYARQPRNAKVNVVCADNEAGGRLAARKLIERGYRKLAYLGGPATTSTNAFREKGFCDAVGEAGVELVARVNATEYTYDAGRKAAIQMLDEHRNIDGVFCGNDLVAFGVMDVARYRHGLTIPDDLGIIGFDDIELASADAYQLTTIRQPMSDMVQQTVDIISQAMAGQDSGNVKRLLFPCTLIERGTLR
ncbi:LacI family DNA-binding transcriptional regulator [Saccharospirillum sp.]|uniref:LacI family DNA-binding transcriptional regulator n=1 Tax=Saccharospirillum sp. TaxID=2033801 RepID=UPI0034A00A82